MSVRLPLLVGGEGVVPAQFVPMGHRRGWGKGTSPCPIDWRRRRSSPAPCAARWAGPGRRAPQRSAEHTSELQSLMRISYAVFCLKKKQTNNHNLHQHITATLIDI